MPSTPGRDRSYTLRSWKAGFRVTCRVRGPPRGSQLKGIRLYWTVRSLPGSLSSGSCSIDYYKPIYWYKLWQAASFQNLLFMHETHAEEGVRVSCGVFGLLADFVADDDSALDLVAKSK
jgi:hypothetical protein